MFRHQFIPRGSDKVTRSEQCIFCADLVSWESCDEGPWENEDRTEAYEKHLIKCDHQGVRLLFSVMMKMKRDFSVS
jgi:hypothetical protein